MNRTKFLIDHLLFSNVKPCVLYCGLVLVKLVRSEGGRSLCAEISHGKDPPHPPFLAWSVSGLSSAVEPPDAPMDATLPFSLMSMTSVVSHSAVLIADVVSNSAKH